jgi:hypothetical protein
MKYRKLRIAWSVTWGLVAMLLCVWWVRSYWWVDLVGAPRTETWSYFGKLDLHIYSSDFTIGFGVSSDAANDSVFEPQRHAPAFDFHLTDDRVIVTVPHWLLILICVAIASSTWLSFNRFSLRTLLIVTTLVGVGLGLVVYAARK